VSGTDVGVVELEIVQFHVGWASSVPMPWFPQANELKAAVASELYWAVEVKVVDPFAKRMSV